MKRKIEAHLSTGSISLKKIIYVEGDIDCRMIKDFLSSKGITSTKVVEVMEALDDSHLPIEERELAKEKVITLVRSANEDSNLAGKCMGIVDTDYDEKLLIDNLFYTDFNSLESYFLNIEVLNKLIDDFNETELTEIEFQKWLNNTMLFSLYFIFQLRELSSFPMTSHLSFSDLSFCNKEFVCTRSNRIKLAHILKCKTDNCSDARRRFLAFFNEFDRPKIYNGLLYFLHGKHTLRYVICRLKGRYSILNKMQEKAIVNSLKDKFLIHVKVDDFPLFKSVERFASSNN